MKKNSLKLMTLALVGLLSSTTTACSNKDFEETSKPIEVTSLHDYEINVLSEEDMQEMLVNTKIEEKEITYQVAMMDTIVAAKDTNILDADGNLLGTLPEGRKMNLNTLTDDGNYEVTYYGVPAYIDANHVTQSKSSELVGKIKKVLYATKDTVLVVPDYLSDTGEELEVKINALECFEVYEEMDDCYLVQTIDYVGYIAKDNLEELTGTFVVVDISSQELRLYKDNEVIFKCPVVTGTPTKECHTDEGLWDVFDISYNRALKGDSYSSPVDIMIKFHGGEGLHDAEYHSCEYWQKHGKKTHGWRDASAFGGNTYLTNGSHGCVNMRHDDVFYVADYVEIGTPVLVKP